MSFYFSGPNSRKIAGFGEIVLTELSVNSGRVQSWHDGSLLVDKKVTENAAPEGVAQSAFNWGKFNSCLSNAGIAAWAITAIGVACGAACAATVGIGCVVCATSVAGITGSTIGTCAARAMV